MVYSALGTGQKKPRLNVGCPGCYVPIDEACGAMPCTRYGQEPREVRYDGELQGRRGSISCCTCKRCCLCICPTLCCLLLLAAVLGVAWLVPGLFPLAWRFVWCKSFGEQHGCMKTFTVELANSPVGENGVPFGYVTAALALFADSTDDIGMTTVSNWTEVHNLGQELPMRSWEGDWWRGNELGYIVLNPVYWSKIGIYPAAMGPGVTPAQHKIIRPFLKELFVLTTEHQQWASAFLKEFLEERKAAAGKLRVPEDVQVWVHQVLHYVVFNEVVSYSEASEFVALQQAVVTGSTVSQALPGELYGILGIEGSASKIASTIKSFETKLAPRIGGRLDGLQCSPTPSCSLQLASAVFDALTFAGGLSVPSAIHSGLGVLFSTHPTNPSPGFVIPAGMEPQFFWETVRYFPPVWGMPYWTTRPTCVGMTAAATAALNEPGGLTEACPMHPPNSVTGVHPVNQWQGGARVVLNLGRAQWDSERWGPTAAQFELRPVDVYEANSVGFAEMAVDDAVAEGANDRSCPAKALALSMGSVFFEVFRQGDWLASGASEIELLPFDGWVQATSFELFPAVSEA